jgi:hypothetical protein
LAWVGYDGGGEALDIGIGRDRRAVDRRIVIHWCLAIDGRVVWLESKRGEEYGDATIMSRE